MELQCLLQTLPYKMEPDRHFQYWLAKPKERKYWLAKPKERQSN